MARNSPTKADPQSIWGQLLPLISSGASLPWALQQLPEPRPSLWWAKMAVRDDPELAERYRAAMELRADALADEIAAIADQAIPDGLHGSDASAWVQQQRLRVDSKKWLACKLFPRRYADRVEVDVAVDQRLSIIGALAAANNRVAMLTEAPQSVLELEASTRGRNG